MNKTGPVKVRSFTNEKPFNKTKYKISHYYKLSAPYS